MWLGYDSTVEHSNISSWLCFNYFFPHRKFERVPPCSDREWGYSGPNQQAEGRGGELCQPVPHARTGGPISPCEDLSLK